MEFIESTTFTRLIANVVGGDEYAKFQQELSEDPEKGDVMPQCGGVRKVRMATEGKGKSGGARVIYYYLDDEFPIYALLAYAKNSQDNLSPEQSRDVSAFVDMLKVSRRRKQ